MPLGEGRHDLGMANEESGRDERRLEELSHLQALIPSKYSNIFLPQTITYTFSPFLRCLTEKKMGRKYETKMSIIVVYATLRMVLYEP